MPVVVADRELFEACQVLFGFDLHISHEFLEYLQLDGIKSAYRKKARETHPDMIAGNREFLERRHAEPFTRVHEAYVKLTTYLEARENGFRFTAPIQEPPVGQTCRAKNFKGKNHRTYRRTSSGKTNAFSGTPKSHAFTKQRRDIALRHYQGPIPERPLLFGHYLYYSGLICYRSIIQALIWQRSQRPALGEIGLRFGWLEKDDIRIILKNRALLKPFGECAVDLGYLSASQLRILLFRQRSLQKKIGGFFIANKLITPQQLHILIQKHQQHNKRVNNTRVSSNSFRTGM